MLSSKQEKNPNNQKPFMAEKHTFNYMLDVWIPRHT